MAETMQTKGLAPALRFEGVTDAWEQRKLGELIQLGGSGGTPSATNPNYYGGDIPFLGIADIDGRDIVKTAKTLTVEGLQNSAAWVVPTGAVSLAMYASVGKVGIIRQDTATSQAFYNMVFEDEALRDFVFTRLEKADADSEWEPYISTGTQRNLNADKVKSFAMSVPSADEAEAISSCFSNLDSLITLHQRKCERLRHLKAAMLDKMFPKPGELYPELRFEGFTDAWEQRKLGEVSAIKTGVSDLQDADADGKYPFFVRSEIVERSNRYLYDGEAILIPGEGRLGEIYHYINGKFDYHQRVYKISDFESVNGKFVYHAMRASFKEHAIKNTVKATVDSIRLPTLTEFVFTAPRGKDEQSAISNTLDCLDSLITLHQRKYERLKHLKAAMLDKMFI